MQGHEGCGSLGSLNYTQFGVHFFNEETFPPQLIVNAEHARLKKDPLQFFRVSPMMTICTGLGKRVVPRLRELTSRGLKES